LTAKRKEIVESGDYSDKSVRTLTDINTRLDILPHARRKAEGQFASVNTQLAHEIHEQRSAFIQEIQSALEKKQKEVAQSLAPYCENDASAANLASQTDVIVWLNQDLMSLFGITGQGGELVAAAQSLIRLWWIFSAKGKLTH
jgi:hypothetical protein